MSFSPYAQCTQYHEHSECEAVYYLAGPLHKINSKNTFSSDFIQADLI